MALKPNAFNAESKWLKVELQTINISIIFPPSVCTCINHDLHNNHKPTVPTLPAALSINVLALGMGDLHSNSSFVR